jgi:uncharacterized membrane protein (GlpM family)
VQKANTQPAKGLWGEQACPEPVEWAGLKRVAPRLSGHLDIVAKALAGAAIIAVLLALARGRHYVLAGLLVSIPAISLYTWWWIGTEHGPRALKQSVHAAIWSAVPWVAYLCVVYLTAGRAPLWLSLTLGFCTWLVCAVVFAALLHAR